MTAWDHKEFPVMFDWVHNGEGLTVFNLQGLSDPNDLNFQKRVRRFAGFYMNEDAGAPNYDPKHKIIRSMFNGSRGPLLRKATALDWAGDPIEVENRFRLGHGERNYQEMLDHFKEYTDIVGDHPQNLLATSLALNAYMLTGEEKYKHWLLEYVDAWRERMAANNDIIPTNIGLDGKIGSECDGKWYGGAYGWGFTVVVPQTGKLAHRNTHHLGFVGFMNAYLLTADDQYLDAWRKQTARINGQKKTIGGRPMHPRMHGDKGWYDFVPGSTIRTRSKPTIFPCGTKTGCACPETLGLISWMPRMRSTRKQLFEVSSLAFVNASKACAKTERRRTRGFRMTPCNSTRPAFHR